MIEQLLPYFTFNIIELAGLSLLILCFFIQIYFYFGYYKKPYSYVKKMNRNEVVSSNSGKPMVSVVISSENEASHLADNLPSILEQDYGNFEVIVVNNGSTDESDELLQTLKYSNPHLYHTYIPYSNDKRFGRRKLAYTIGAKAAKGDVLLFIEPYARPSSNQWISAMMSEMTDGKDVVLGYSYYKKTHSFFNRIARFDNHLFSMFYLSMAIKGKPFTGVYRNIAYKKHLFFDNKGFASFLHLENGEEAFINQIITSDNTAVALSQDSFVETYLESFALWKQIKKSYSAIKSYFNSSAPLLFGLETFSRMMFYLLLVLSIVYGILNRHEALVGIALFVFILRWIIQVVVLNGATKYFHSGSFFSSLPFMDIMQPLYNLRFKSWKIVRNKR